VVVSSTIVCPKARYVARSNRIVPKFLSVGLNIIPSANSAKPALRRCCWWL
jgi:hypothetical protein